MQHNILPSQGGGAHSSIEPILSFLLMFANHMEKKKVDKKKHELKYWFPALIVDIIFQE